jgi:signal transduction histidine kinase
MEVPDINSKSSLPDAGALLDAGPASVALIDPHSLDLLYVNRQFGAVLGYSKESILEQPVSFYDLLGSGEAERFELQLSLAKTDSKSHNKYSAYKLKTQSGVESLYYIYVSLVQGSEGPCHLFIMPNFSEETFPFNSYDTRDLFLKQLETEKYGSFEWFIDTGLVFWTDSLYDIYEIDKATTVSRELIAGFTHPDDSKKGTVAMQRAIEDGVKIELEMKIISGKGNNKVIKVLASIIKDDNGRSVKLAGSVKDITAQRQIEQHLKRKVEELHKSNTELEEFAYVASHDLQEPLRKISTFSDRLADKYGDILTGDGAMYLERMMVSAENMRMLINNLLEFSRVTRSSDPFSRVSLDFVVRQVRNDLELIVEETGTKFELDKLPELHGSLVQLTQLFTNIINNAIKFRRPDVAPLIRIALASATKDELMALGLPADVSHHRITIADNGIGFEKEYSEKIFQIFQRLHGKSEYPGSGIGLAICKRIVENHKGAIYAESTEGEGATFTLLFPVSEQNTADA